MHISLCIMAFAVRCAVCDFIGITKFVISQVVIQSFLVGINPPSHSRLTLVPSLTFSFELPSNKDKLAVLWIAYL